MMRVFYLSRFDRVFKKLDHLSQRRVSLAVELLLNSLGSGSRPQGLGLRRLQGALWELRAGLQLRILFELRQDTLTFVFVGSHDDIQKFLKSL